MSFEFRIGHETGILAASSAYLNCLDYLPRNACERRAMLDGDGKEVGLLSGQRPVAPAGGWRTYSIISSARARNASGMLSPMALAAFTFTTSSNLVGC